MSQPNAESVLPRPLTLERVGGGWVIIDASGLINTPRPMTEESARAFANVLGIEWPEAQA